jgi:nucleoside-diphosphate-sugar epimerase
VVQRVGIAVLHTNIGQASDTCKARSHSRLDYAVLSNLFLRYILVYCVQQLEMRRVLLTGANTLVGSHILDRLLASTVSVRAVVASRDDAQSLQQCYSWAYPSQLDFAIVPAKETTTQGAYDNALRSHSHPFDAVVHTLAAEPSEGADCLSRFITLETEMLTSFLKSVRDVAGSVERVVFVTSLTPFARWLVDPSPLRNPVASTASSSRQPDIDVEYVLATSQASDNIVCDALWEWSKSARPRFDLVAISAPSIYGPSLRSLANSSDLQEANRRIWNMFSNDSRESISYPPYGIDFYADVRVSIGYSWVEKYRLTSS